MSTLETPSQVTSATQPVCNTSCVSGDAARVVEGHLNLQKGAPTIRTSGMGSYNSVPGTSRDEDTVKANITFSRSGEDLFSNVKMSRINESQKVKAREKEENDARNKPLESECQDACPRGNGDPGFRVVNKLHEQEPCINPSKDRVMKPKESLVRSTFVEFGSGSFEDIQKDEISSEDSCDSFSSLSTTILFPNKCHQDRNTKEGDNSKSEQKNVENSSIIYNKSTDSISKKCSQYHGDVSLKVENRNWKAKNIDVKCISKQTMNKETLQPHSQNHKSCVEASNKADLETSVTNFEITIEEVQMSKETVDRVSNNCTQNHDDTLLEVENRNRKENNIVFKHISEKTMSEETSLSHCQNLKSREGVSNRVDLERETDIEDTIEEVPGEKNTIITNTKHRSAGIDSAVTGDICSVPNDESVDDQEQQIESEAKKNKTFLKKKDQETKENDTGLISAENCSSISQKSVERCEIDELLKIDSNSCDKDNFEIEPVSEPSSQDETLQSSGSDCEVNTVTKCEDNSNAEAIRLPIQIEINQELSTNSTESTTKEHSPRVSSEHSPIKHSPIFQRGSFPRIVIRDCGIRTIRRLRKQLFQERKKREKREQQRRDKLDNKQKPTRKRDVKNRKIAKNLSTLEYDSSKICGSRDIKLKCAQVCLVKMSERMLSKYNVHLLSPHSHASVCSKLNDDDDDNDKLSISAKRNNLTPEITSQVESAELIPEDREQTENNRFSLGMEDAEKFKKGNNYACAFDDTSGSGPRTVKIISNSRRSRKISHLENIANNFTENDNSLKCMEIKGRSKRRISPQLHTTTRNQRQSEMKKARVHILKIDNSVLSKYGYDCQNLEIGKVALEPGPSFAHLSSVCSPADEGNFQKSVVSNKLNNQILLNQSTCAINDSYPVSVEDNVHLVPMMNNEKEEMNVNTKATNPCKKTGLEAVQLILNDEDVPLSNYTLLKNTSPNRAEKSKRKTKCPLKKNNLNIKAPQVMLRRLEGVNSSSCIVPRKSSNLIAAKTTRKTNSTFKNTPLDKRIPQVIVRKIEDSSSSNHMLLKRSKSTTKPETKTKSSIRGESSSRTAKVIVKNFNHSPLATHVLSKNLLLRTHSNDRVSKNNLNIHSSESLQVKTLPNKQIICRSKHCDDFQNQNKTKTNKANSSKNDVVQDHPKENVCVNSSQKCLRVSLYKLENIIPPKLLSSQPVVFNS